jgi:hypothetical protein
MRDSAWRIAASVIVAMTMFLFGCAGSTAPITRAKLMAEANAICLRVFDEVDWRKTPPYRLVRLARRLGELEIRASTELARFQPPASIAIYWQAMVDHFQATGQEFEKLADDPPMGAQEAFSAIEPVLNAMRQRAAVARSSGLDGCGRY